MSIKTLKFRKEISLWEKTIDNTHRIVGVEGGHKSVSRRFNGFEVPRSDITTDTNKGESFHQRFIILSQK